MPIPRIKMLWHRLRLRNAEAELEYLRAQHALEIIRQRDYIDALRRRVRIDCGRHETADSVRRRVERAEKAPLL